MTFPTTSILDDFNRADETPLSGGGNWAALDQFIANLDLASNRVTSSGGYSYWTTSTDANCESYSTFISGSSVRIFARLKDVGGDSIFDGYCIAYVGGTLILMKATNSTLAQIGVSSYSVTLVSGNKIGLRCLGSTIEGWLYSSGVWANVLSETDSTYPNGGYIGVGIDSGSVLDDFGGGTWIDPDKGSGKKAWFDPMLEG